jgi:hypothetical protein
MIQLSLKDEVSRALKAPWAEFAARHPRLAAVIDTTLLIEEAVRKIEDDPAWRKALDDGAAAEAGLGALGELIGRAVRHVLAKLFS